MISIGYTTDVKKVVSLLNGIDDEFYPPISVQEGGIDKYTEILVNNGKIIVGESDEKIAGFAGYFIKDGSLNFDILWVEKEYRKSPVLYRILQYVFQQEPCDGTVVVKTHDKNTAMASVLNKLNFKKYSVIRGDYVPDRTSIIFKADIRDIRKYFGV